MALAPGFSYAPKRQMSFKQVKRLAEAFGLPGTAMAQIAKGESGLRPSIQQRDPGDGMVGYGLLQMTPNAWGQGSAAQKKLQQLGGIKAMKDPVKNMQMARFLYKSAGNSLQPWHGTRFLTDRSGEGDLGPVNSRLIDRVAGGQRGRGGGGGGGGPVRRGTTETITSSLNTNTAMLPALGTLASTRPTRSLSPPGPTSFAARAPLPAGYMDNSVSTGAIQSSRQTGSSLQDMIDQIGSGSPVDPIRQTSSRAYSYGGGGRRGGGGGQTVRGGPAVARATKRANTFERKAFPYKWGGGHGTKLTRGKDFVPVDCSGAVSAVLGINPRVSGQFESWGKAGDSGRKGITVYANDTHVLMKINGKFFGTSGSNRGGGAGWIEAHPGRDYLSNFTARHL